MQKFSGIGKLGRDPETTQTKNGKSVTKFSIAFNQGGNKNQETLWVSASAWEKGGQIIQQYCKKGSTLYVEGSLSTREFDKKDGSKGFSLDLNVRDFELQSSGQAERSTNLEEVQDEDEGEFGDIPF